MSDMFGEKLKIALFGESHGAGVGAVISGLPAGFEIDFEAIRRDMARRAPGNSDLATPRKEADEAEVLSGVFNGRTTGTALAILIRNTNTRSGDYQPELPRPGHADYTAQVKYGGYQDYRGGGHFSARVTAPLVWAGSLAKQILAQKGISLAAHIARIGAVEDTRFTQPDAAMLEALSSLPFPVLNPDVQQPMRDEVLAAKAALDSVGGIIECAAVGVPAGLGDPFFDSMESRLSHLLFSVPAIKGVEFGEGFGLASMRGSAANDPFCMENGRVVTATNHNGGINGGITNGMPLVFRVACKPTPSIAQTQQTVNLQTGENAELSIHGRHDPCIVPRAVPVVEACTALCLLDALL
ncbi:MAG: chorismate synthase [Clostridia bacterium]|nr:chorismate synthase [Clostridia bacterium]